VAETPEKEPEPGTLGKETQLDGEPATLNRRSSRMQGIIVSSLTAFMVIGAAATYALPEFNIAVPHFSSFAEVFSDNTASAPIPDSDVNATLKDIQLAQERNAAALQENRAVVQQNAAMLQRGAAALESVREGFMAQQMSLKVISNQLSSLIVRVDSLKNSSMPLTTSSIPQPNSGRFVRTSRKKTSRVPNQPVGPVSVGGAPLNPTPGRARVRFSAADARDSGPASRLFNDVIDPVQSRKANEDQVDSHCEAQNPGCDHVGSSGQSSDRQ
jgi:hypothetical protein